MVEKSWVWLGDSSFLYDEGNASDQAKAVPTGAQTGVMRFFVT